MLWQRSDNLHALCAHCHDYQFDLFQVYDKNVQNLQSTWTHEFRSGHSASQETGHWYDSRQALAHIQILQCGRQRWRSAFAKFSSDQPTNSTREITKVHHRRKVRSILQENLHQASINPTSIQFCTLRGAPALGGAGGRVLHRNWPRGDALLNTGKWKWVFVETNSLNATLGISKDYTLTSRHDLCTTW